MEGSACGGGLAGRPTGVGNALIGVWASAGLGGWGAVAVVEAEAGAFDPSAGVADDAEAMRLSNKA